MKTTTKFHDIISKTQVALLIFAFFISSCTKDEETVAPGQAPELPPTTTMVMNFNDFANADTTAYKSTNSYHNWGWAAGHVLVWNVIITINMAVPVASFYEAFNHLPVYDPENDLWRWSYNFIAGNVWHLAELTGKKIDEGVEWNMYITKNNHYNDFLWYSGVSNYQNQEGYWEMNSTPQNPEPLLRIDWERDLTDTTASVTYTNIVPGGPENGGYIQYGLDDGELDAFYNIFNKGQDNLINIKWSRTQKNGQVKDPMHFNGEEWHCWDEMLMDTDCN